MTLDLAELRARLVTGWKPRMDVSIEVATLDALLTELEHLRVLAGECDEETP